MSRKNDIIKAATELFSQQGFHATSTHQVAKLAEVSEGIIFYYFKTKEEILLAIFEEAFDSFVLETQKRMASAPNGMEALHAWFKLNFEAVHSRTKEILLLVRDFPASLTDEHSPHRERVMSRVRKLNQVLTEMIVSGQKDGSVAAGDPDLTALVLRSMIIGSTRLAMLELPRPQPFAETLWSFCQRALTPDPNHA